jgi:hypothetical protein
MSVAMEKEEQILPCRGRTSVDVDESMIQREGFQGFIIKKGRITDIYMIFL